MSHYADDKVFRTGDGSEIFEALAPTRGDRGFVISLDSWDAPELSMRIDRDAAVALAEWITARLEA